MIGTTIVWYEAETLSPKEYGEYLVCIGRRNRPKGYVYEIAMFIPCDDRGSWEACDAYEGCTYPLDDVIYWAEIPKITIG